MATYNKGDDLKGTEFRDSNLTGARFVECDLTEVVVRGSEVARMDIDAPWLVHGDYLRVNGVDVTAYVEGELDARFPGRSDRRAADLDGLRAAWASVERAWDAALARAAAMPAGSVDVSVDGEWSFAQTLRHLVHATDVWLGKAVLEIEDPFHPLGLGYSPEGVVAEEAVPSYDEVLAARASRVAQVRDFLASATADDLAVARKNPHNPDHPETTRSCLHVILEEMWEHLRFAVRDLDAIEAQAG
jgi:uncharacterized damage-inducible protein DinB